VSAAPEHETPWSVLGLPPRTSDRREIRRAYATLLRRHTPEDDPAGFRRIRSAYEWLTSVPPEVLARWGEATDEGDGDSIDDECGNVADPPARPEEGAEQDSGPAPPPVREEPRATTTTAAPAEVGTHEVPIELAPAEPPQSEPPLVALRSAARIADRDRRGLALATALARALEDHDHGELEAEEIHQELEQLPTPEIRAQVAALASGRALIEVAERGEGGLLLWTAATLAHAEDLPALARLAAALEPRAQAVGLAAGPWTLIGVARASAVAAPETARRLLDEGWKESSAALRNDLDVDGVDLGIAVGRSVLGAKPAVRRLVHRLVWDPADYAIGGRPEPESLLQKFARAQAPNSPLRMRAPGLAPVPVVAGRGAPAAAKESSGFPWWLLVILALGVGRGLMRDGEKGSDDALRRLRENPLFQRRVPLTRGMPLSAEEERELERLDALEKSGRTLSTHEQARQGELWLRRVMHREFSRPTPPREPAPRPEGR
jgi:hypothetical protein